MKIFLRLLIPINAILINAGFLISFWIRYGFAVPQRSFAPYRKIYIFLTLIYILSLLICGIYKKRFKTSFDLFKRTAAGLLLGTLLSFVFVYIFREKWLTFPTSIFAIAFFVNLILIFKFNQFILKRFGRIRQKILVIGNGATEDIIVGKADIIRINAEDVQNIAQHTDIDEIIVCDIPKENNMGFLAYLVQKLKTDIIFSPACYVKLLPEKINGDSFSHTLATFITRKRDAEEAAMRALDIAASIIILILAFPMLAAVALLIKLTSKGPVLYKQIRVGKDGELFTLYKFRTMIHDAEKELGPVLAQENDPRITKIGKFLRATRIDEFPQLFNVLKGEMSLVGPRPERPYFVKRHKVLMEMRLAVRPGLTGLAQVRNSYDLTPKHKIKYDYLYIQRRSLLLNLYILAQTIPVMFRKMGR